MSESTPTTSKPKPPEIDLDQFAAVSVVKRSIARGGGVRKLANPFEKIVKASYDTPWTDEDGTEHEHGEPRLTVPLAKDSEEEKAVLRALTRAGRHLGVSINKEFSDRDAEGRKIREPKRAILFSAVELQKRERKPNGDKPEGDAAQASEGDQGAPAEGGQSDDQSMTGEQEGTPQAPGEQDNPTVVPDQQPEPAGSWS